MKWICWKFFINFLNKSVISEKLLLTFISVNLVRIYVYCLKVTYFFIDFQNEIANAYDPKEVEKDWYEWWEKNGYMRPQLRHGNEERFSIILPPPNVTGTLHLGHTLTVAIQDSVVRW